MKVMKKVLKQTLAFILVFAMLAGVMPTGYVDNAVTVEAAETGRQVVDISKEWKFYKGSADNAQKTDFNDSKWEDVNIPHTWNATDGADGGGNYYKGDGWYRKKLAWNDVFNDKRVFIEFLGANKQADVYVNGTHKGNHKGGYTCFRYDITDDLKKNQENVIAVKVNNEDHHAIAPLSGDFTFYGGIYREVTLVVTDPVHVDTLDYGSSGLKLTTKNVSKQSADLNIKSTIRNNSGSKKSVKVKAVLKHPDSFEEVEGIDPDFDVTKMYGGGVVKEVEKTISVESGKTADFSEDIKVDSPHLWNGRKDPYRYQVDLTVTVDGQVVDSVTEYVGFRYFKVDFDKGFFLNGESYPLRGVCRHQDREGLGSALTQKEHDEDFKIMYDIGANTVRLAHYPQAPYFYELCDKYGIVVWAEIPFVNKPADDSKYKSQSNKQKEFVQVTRQQMIEMIRQQYNRPGIIFWGLQNEVKDSYQDFMTGFMKELSDLAHEEDPTGRLTTQATDKDHAYAWESDIFGWNRYPGSYTAGELGNMLDEYHSEDDRPVGISEYGVASVPEEHKEEPGGWVDNEKQHEEFANKQHEKFIKDINDREYLWGTYLWNLFDFGADHREEGGKQGINTKGLVTFDRKTFKDVFYLYKAYWNPDPFVYITSRRFEKREKEKVSVKIYSNCDNVTLTVNGKKIGELKQSQLNQPNVFIWDNVALDRASNTVEVSGTKDGKLFKDSCVWKRSNGDDATIYSTDLPISGKDKTIQLAKDVEISKIEEVIQTDSDKVIGVYKQDNGKLIYQTDGKVETGMVLAVFADGGKTAEYYTFIPGSYTLKKSVSATSEENKTDAVNLAKNAVDGDNGSRWAASSSNYPQSITVDMGEKKTVKKVRISWYVNGDRKYKYKVSVSDKKDSGYKEIVNRSNNNEKGTVTDDANGTGRYLKVEVTGSSSGGNASIYEIEAFGEQPKIYTSDKVNVDKLPEAISENSDEPQEGMLMHRMEVESGTISGTTRQENGDDAGVNYVYLNIKEGDALDGKVSFKVACDKAGNRKMRIYYCHQFATALKISLNGKELKSMEVPLTAAFFGLGITPLRITLPLVEGTNEIVLEGVDNVDAPWMDYFNIELTQDEVDKTKELANTPGDNPTQKDEEGTSYEAEKATLTDACQIVDGKNSSGGKHVTEIGGSKEGQATFAVEAEKAGIYTLDVHYITQEDREFEVTVNDGTATVVKCAGNNNDWDTTVEKATVEVELKEGANTILIGNKEDVAPNLDRIVLNFKEEVQTPPGDDELKAIDELKEELKSVVETAEIFITAGQQEYTTETWEAFVAAYDEAKDVKEDADAETLTKLTTELKTTMSSLKKNDETEPDPQVAVAIQKAALTTVMNATKSTYETEQDKYTTESWSVFKAAYENAVKEMNNAETTADALKKCEEALTAAQKALVPMPVEPETDPEKEKELEAAKKAATEAMEAAQEIYESDSEEYEEATWSVFEEAYEALEKALKAEDATAETLTECTEELNAAYEALEKKVVTPDTEQKPDTKPEPGQKPDSDPASGMNVQQNTPQYMSGVQVTADKAALYYGGNADNTAMVTVSLPIGAASQSVTYVSNNENAAKVDAAGKITAVGKGDAVITAKVTLTTGETKDFNLNVTVMKAYIAKVKVKSTVKVGKKVALKAKAYGSDKSITWKIKSGAKYAKVSKAGKLTAKAKGKVKVTAKSGKISKTFTIRIK